MFRKILFDYSHMLRNFFLFAVLLLYGASAIAQQRIDKSSLGSSTRARNFSSLDILSIDTAVLAQGMDARQVIERYLDARGGRVRISQLKNTAASMSSTGKVLVYGTEMPYPGRPSIRQVAANGEGYVSVDSVGMFGYLGKRIFRRDTLENIYNDSHWSYVTGYDSLTAEMRLDTYVVPEMAYDALGCQAKLLGVAILNNKQAYVVRVQIPDDIRQLDFYDVESGLKVRSIRTTDGVVDFPAATDYGDYRSVGGVLFPHRMVVPIHIAQATMPFFYLENVPRYRSYKSDDRSYPMDVRWEVNIKNDDTLYPKRDKQFRLPCDLSSFPSSPRDFIPLPSTHGLAQGMDAQQVIERYLQAIGGRKKIGRIKNSTAHLTGTGELLFMNMRTKVGQVELKEIKANGRSYWEERYQGNVHKKTLYDGRVAASYAFLKPESMPDTSSLKRGAVMDDYVIPEMAYAQLGIQTKLLGIVPFEDKQAYAVAVSIPVSRCGVVSLYEQYVDLFDVGSGLKVRRISASNLGPDITDYQDYRSVDGVLFPHRMVIPVTEVTWPQFAMYMVESTPVALRMEILKILASYTSRLPMDVRWEMNTSEARSTFPEM